MIAAERGNYNLGVESFRIEKKETGIAAEGI